MKVYLVWASEEWENDILFKIFSKEEDAEKYKLEQEKADEVDGPCCFHYFVTSEDVE